LVKFSEGPTVIKGPDDTIFTLCSVRPHDYSNLNVPLGNCAYLRM